MISDRYMLSMPLHSLLHLLHFLFIQRHFYTPRTHTSVCAHTYAQTRTHILTHTHTHTHTHTPQLQNFVIYVNHHVRVN